MSAADVVMASYWLAILGLIVVAIAYAVHEVRPSFEPAVRTSWDCRDGKHGGCQGCDGCSCHARWSR